MRVLMLVRVSAVAECVVVVVHLPCSHKGNDCVGLCGPVVPIRDDVQPGAKDSCEVALLQAHAQTVGGVQVHGIAFARLLFVWSCPWRTTPGSRRTVCFIQSATWMAGSIASCMRSSMFEAALSTLPCATCLQDATHADSTSAKSSPAACCSSRRSLDGCKHRFSSLRSNTCLPDLA